MASQAPGSNPSARWLKPVTPTQLLGHQARLARAQASKKGRPAKEKNPLGRLPDDSSVGVACISSSVCLALCDSLWIAWDCLCNSTPEQSLLQSPPAATTVQIGRGRTILSWVGVWICALGSGGGCAPADGSSSGRPQHACNLFAGKQVVEKVAHRLMAAAVADPSERVRVTVLAALQGTTALDEFLGQGTTALDEFLGQHCKAPPCSVNSWGRWGLLKE
eukprot:1160269-Pelagomonas_calceolata.AAC.17